MDEDSTDDDRTFDPAKHSDGLDFADEEEEEVEEENGRNAKRAREVSHDKNNDITKANKLSIKAPGSSMFGKMASGATNKIGAVHTSSCDPASIMELNACSLDISAAPCHPASNMDLNASFLDISAPCDPASSSTPFIIPSPGTYKEYSPGMKALIKRSYALHLKKEEALLENLNKDTWHSGKIGK